MCECVCVYASRVCECVSDMCASVCEYANMVCVLCMCMRVWCVYVYMRGVRVCVCKYGVCM